MDETQKLRFFIWANAVGIVGELPCDTNLDRPETRRVVERILNNIHESSITFTSGYNNVKPQAGRVLMAGWAAGVEGVARALAVDLRPISVNCVCPGAVRTELFDGLPKHLLDPLVEKYVSRTLSGTIGQPEQAAEAYLYCMRDAFVDGTVVHSNGGYLLG
ncbi:uncharacterized protein Z520_06618 [Fonsecaea multimorphosa CBS 102226]|uniref:Uncharacterized protein n=1 Tax=Fonsecaea multimorphosa CBS 102226 TaxID=1442371 RepID=A0A0D2H7N6_9EURO|nr:uncharacterized protein Z520_06618 [Fonsecaea multimorphosa CBS 102226]KIX97840.1 hypothetical protein Z520_06618 [Fonsecaea multimorphosa CBS 102226]OAL23610.1 hypothetical protein AYO22_06187 [Fonsecaea multimorphosa]